MNDVASRKSDDSSGAGGEGPRIGLVLMTDRPKKDDHVPRYGMNLTYFAALRSAGGRVVPIAPGPLAELDMYFARGDSSGCLQLDGLCLPGGGDPHASFFGEDQSLLAQEPDFERDRTELHLLRLAGDARMPILGICRGIQMINIARGGTLIQDIATEHGTMIKHDNWNGTPRDLLAHEILIEDGSLLARLAGAARIQVNSLHHQALERLGAGLRVTARALDGIVEAVEPDAVLWPDAPFLLGVQFHPEDLQAIGTMRKIFSEFVEAAARYRSLRV